MVIHAVQLQNIPGIRRAVILSLDQHTAEPRLLAKQTVDRRKARRVPLPLAQDAVGRCLRVLLRAGILGLQELVKQRCRLLLAAACQGRPLTWGSCST